jgi:hypothetical protein
MSTLVIYDENGNEFSRVSGAYVEIENQVVPAGFTITQVNENLPQSFIAVDKTTLNADGLDSVTFSSVPVGALVFVNGEFRGSTVESDQGQVTYQTDLTGLHKVLIRHDLYLDYEVTLNAN